MIHTYDGCSNFAWTLNERKRVEKKKREIVTKQIFFYHSKLPYSCLSFEKILYSIYSLFVKVNLLESIRLMWFLFHSTVASFLFSFWATVCDVDLLFLFSLSMLFVRSFVCLLFICDKSHFACIWFRIHVWYFIQYCVDLFRFQMIFYMSHHFQCYQNISRIRVLFQCNIYCTIYSTYFIYYERFCLCIPLKLSLFHAQNIPQDDFRCENPLKMW